jgi:hypothetical protein
MKNFKDLGIIIPEPTMKGPKISIHEVLNTEVTVLNFVITDSKYSEKGNGKCLNLQLEVDKIKRVLFSGSGVLMDTIQKIPANSFPFVTKIVKRNERFEFT